MKTLSGMRKQRSFLRRRLSYASAFCAARFCLLDRTGHGRQRRTARCRIRRGGCSGEGRRAPSERPAMGISGARPERAASGGKRPADTAAISDFRLSQKHGSRSEHRIFSHDDGLKHLFYYQKILGGKFFKVDRRHRHVRIKILSFDADET